jgi:alpha-L-rhamnosidase
MNSFNHYAYGVVLSWIYRTVAGIREGKCGYKDFVLSPIPDRRIGSVKAQYDSPYGVITSSWKYEKSGLWIWNFTIPANSSATVVYPDGAIKRLGAGSYSCCIDLDDEKVK